VHGVAVRPGHPVILGMIKAAISSQQSAVSSQQSAISNQRSAIRIQNSEIRIQNLLDPRLRVDPRRKVLPMPDAECRMLNAECSAFIIALHPFHSRGRISHDRDRRHPGA
jgi:hypothetical protein